MTSNDIYVRALPAKCVCASVADVTGFTGDDSRNIRGDWDRGLWVDKQRIGGRNRCGTFDVPMASMGVAGILLGDDDIPRVDLHLHERAGRGARRTS